MWDGFREGDALGLEARSGDGLHGRAVERLILGGEAHVSRAPKARARVFRGAARFQARVRADFRVASSAPVK